MTNLERLEKLTTKLGELQEAPMREFAEITRQAYTPSIVNIAMKKGTGIMFGLDNTIGYSIAKTFVSANSKFFSHSHPDKREYLTVLSGSMDVYLDGECTTMGYGDCIYIPPGTPHYAKFPEDTWFIATIFPEDQSWPEGLKYYGDHKMGDK